MDCLGSEHRLFNCLVIYSLSSAIFLYYNARCGVILLSSGNSQQSNKSFLSRIITLKNCFPWWCLPEHYSLNLFKSTSIIIYLPYLHNLHCLTPSLPFILHISFIISILTVALYLEQLSSLAIVPLYPHKIHLLPLSILFILHTSFIITLECFSSFVLDEIY